MPLHVDEDAAPASAPLDYAKPQGPSRRQFSLLLLLVFINTVMFAAFFCLPAVSPIVKQTWADYQKRKAEQQKEQQRQALLQQVKTYAAPANQVIYEEDPTEIQKLYAESSDWSTGRVQTNTAPSYPPGPIAPIIRVAPPPLAQLQKTANDMIGGAFSHYGVSFVHARKDPTGREYLVCVTTLPQLTASFVRREESGQTYRYVYDLKRDLNLTAYAVPADGSPRTITIMNLDEPAENHGRVTYTVASDKPQPSTLTGGTPEILSRSLLRILSGQPDPADPSHFTIPYVLNGKPGVIDGYLRANGRVMLQPREGQFLRWSNANSYHWELSQTPTTRPSP